MYLLTGITFTMLEFVTGQISFIYWQCVFQSEDPQVMMESTNLVTELISILIRKHELFFPETEDEDLYPMRQLSG